MTSSSSHTGHAAKERRSQASSPAAAELEAAAATVVNSRRARHSASPTCSARTRCAPSPRWPSCWPPRASPSPRRRSRATSTSSARVRIRDNDGALVYALRSEGGDGSPRPAADSSALETRLRRLLGELLVTAEALGEPRRAAYPARCGPVPRLGPRPRRPPRRDRRCDGHDRRRRHGPGDLPRPARRPRTRPPPEHRRDRLTVGASKENVPRRLYRPRRPHPPHRPTPSTALIVPGAPRRSARSQHRHVDRTPRPRPRPRRRPAPGGARMTEPAKPSHLLWSSRFSSGPSDALAALSASRRTSTGGWRSTTWPAPGRTRARCTAPGC